MIRNKNLLPLIMVFVFSGCTRLPAYDDTYVIIAPTVSETMAEMNSTETQSTDDSEWKSHAKDVDINPEDQAKSVYDFYMERTQ